MAEIRKIRKAPRHGTRFTRAQAGKAVTEVMAERTVEAEVKELRKIRILPRPGASVSRAEVRKAVKAVIAEREAREAAAAAKRGSRRSARKTN